MSEKDDSLKAVADPNFDQPGKIDLFIGCNALQDIFTADIKRGSSKPPMAMRTILGWAILRSLQPDLEHPLFQPALVGHAAASFSSDDLLRCFWETEEVSAPATCYTPEEQVVVKHFQFNHS